MHLTPENDDVQSGTFTERKGERKIIVLDTSVLLNDPESIFAFSGCDIVLPLKVIEELDGHKTRNDDTGRAARQVARSLEELRLRSDGEKLSEPVELGEDSTIRIALNGLALDKIKEHGLSAEDSDNRILAAALGLSEKNPDAVVRLVSADVNLRLKAAAFGLEAAEYIQVHGAGKHDNKHPGWRKVAATQEDVDILREEKWLPLNAATSGPELTEVATNEYVIFDNGSSTIARRTKKDGVEGFELFNENRRNVAWNLKGRSLEQKLGLDLLLNPDIPIVGMSGTAGTGKTILALASALEQTVGNAKGNYTGSYDRIMILRPVVPLGNQGIGFLPGTLEEKLGPWMEAITDATVALGKSTSYQEAKASIDKWVEEGRLTLESVTFLRGRSLQNTFIIVDEAQNLEPLTLKTILTRLGQGSKVVLVGDVSQIDNPWSSERSNAISVLADRFSGQELFGHIVLKRGERSAAADLAAKLL